MARLIAERGRRCEKRGPTCNNDGSGSVRIYGDHVQEIKDGGALLDPGNIMLVCPACHGAKTAAAKAERMARRHR